MSLLDILTILIVLSALFAYVNERFIQLPQSIGLMILALVLSLALIASVSILPGAIDLAKDFLKRLDFSDALMNFMLGFILFASGLHANWNQIKRSGGAIAAFASIGVIISTLVLGVLLYYALQLLEIDLPFLQCLLFGALISPTDPIAVVGILKKTNLRKETEAKIIGESLFNDGFGIVIFIVILRLALKGADSTTPGEVGWLLLKEVGGGFASGFLLGYLGYHLLRSIDHYQTEVLITIAMVLLGNFLTSRLHFSGPLCMVTAGLFIGSRGRREAMSDETTDYMFKFWELVEEIMNSLLFVLIGLEIVLVKFSVSYVWTGVLAAILVLVVRYGTLSLISLLFKSSQRIDSKTISVMTWGGLRGGISIALALTIPLVLNRNILLPVTYVVVIFSIIVQGLTIGRFVKRLTG